MAEKDEVKLIMGWIKNGPESEKKKVNLKMNPSMVSYRARHFIVFTQTHTKHTDRQRKEGDSN